MHTAYDPENEVTEEMPAYEVQLLLELGECEYGTQPNLEQRDTLPVMWGE